MTNSWIQVGRRVRPLVAALLAAVTASAAGAAAVQQDGPDRAVPVRIALQIGGIRYDASETGVCLHTPGGSIYDAPADAWSVRHSGAGQRLNLSLWKLKTGGDVFTLHVSKGTTEASIDTVKVGTKMTTSGLGRVTLQTGAKGGTFTIEGSDARGVRVSGTVTCDAFTAPVEDNGQ